VGFSQGKAGGGIAHRRAIFNWRLDMGVKLSPVLGRFLAGAALVLATALPVRAQAGPSAAMDDEWHFALVPYFWFAGIDGTVTVKGLVEVPIEKSFSDVMSDFDIGILGHFEGRKNRWGFAFDTMYLNLGAPVAAGAPVLGGLGISADVRLLMQEGLGFYRVANGGKKDNPSHLDLLVGARYFGVSARLKNDEFETAKQDMQWVDALVGLRFRVRLGSRVSLIGRGDVAGFGSQFTWNLEGDLAVNLSERWALGAGWRHTDIDYDKGEGRDRKVFDVAFDGPRAWVAYSW
jgi:hypothetical protein